MHKARFDSTDISCTKGHILLLLVKYDNNNPKVGVQFFFYKQVGIFCNIGNELRSKEQQFSLHCLETHVGKTRCNISPS